MTRLRLGRQKWHTQMLYSYDFFSLRGLPPRLQVHIMHSLRENRFKFGNIIPKTSNNVILPSAVQRKNSVRHMRSVLQESRSNTAGSTVPQTPAFKMDGLFRCAWESLQHYFSTPRTFLGWFPTNPASGLVGNLSPSPYNPSSGPKSLESYVKPLDNLRRFHVRREYTTKIVFWLIARTNKLHLKENRS